MSLLVTHKKKTHDYQKKKGIDKKYICSICSSIGDPKVLDKHISEAHAESAELLLCPKCGFSTYVEKILKKHHRAKHTSKGQSKTCEHCGKIFKSNQKLHTHIDRIHPETGQQKFMCQHCDKTFIYESSLKEHRFHCVNQNTEERQAKRKKYAETAYEKMKLKKKSKASKDPPKYGCEKCGAKFQTEEIVRQHIINTHQPMDCEYCGKKFPNAYRLKRHHVLSHNITKGSIQCPRCPNSVFFSKGQYQKHLKQKHKC